MRCTTWRAKGGVGGAGGVSESGAGAKGQRRFHAAASVSQDDCSERLLPREPTTAQAYLVLAVPLEPLVVPGHKTALRQGRRGGWVRGCMGQRTFPWARHSIAGQQHGSMQASTGNSKKSRAAQSAVAAPERTCTSTYGSKPSSYGMRYEMLVSNQRAWSVALRRGTPEVEARRSVWCCAAAQKVGCAAFRRGSCQGRSRLCCLPMQQLHNNMVQTTPAQPSAPVPAVVVVHVEAAQLAVLEQL